MSSVTRAEGSGFERLTRAVTAFRVPEKIRAAMEAEPGDPTPGQLWRARWGELRELLLVLDIGDDIVTAAPVSLDDRYVDEQVVVLAPEQASLEVSVAVWLGLIRPLPMCVLDRQLGATALDVTATAWADRAVDTGAARGREAINPLDPLNEVRSRLVDAMEVLAGAQWAPAGTGDLAGILARESISPQQLVDVLAVSPQRALALRRGKAAATAEDAAALSSLLRITESQVLEANPAPTKRTVRELSRPRRRAQVVQLAARRGSDERSAWQTVAYGIDALAARQPGELSQQAWVDRVDRYLQVLLGP